MSEGADPIRADVRTQAGLARKHPGTGSITGADVDRHVTDSGDLGSGSGRHGGPVRSATIRRRLRSAMPLLRGEGERSSTISDVVRSSILPLLFRAHAADALPVASPQRLQSIADMHPALPSLDDFEVHLIAADAGRAIEMLEASFEAGASFEDVVFDLIIPMAHRLGEAWNTDRLGFADVTVATSTLQVLTRRLDSLVEREMPLSSLPGKRLLMCAAPGDNHDIGAVLIEQIFRHAGFEVATLLGNSEEAILAAVSRMNADMVGISLGRSSLAPRLNDLIRQIRAQHPDRHIPILVGGSALMHDPQACFELDADALVSNARDAVEIGRALLCA
jgi:MerR family transcriptional regulator, light-induced transcriptional regulator